MADQDKSSKTEQPTEKRKKEFKEKGDIAQSKDLSSSFLLLASVLTFIFVGSFMWTNMVNYLNFSFSHLESETIAPLMKKGLNSFFKVTSPLFIITILAAIGITLIQTKGTISWQKLAPDFSRFNIISRLKQMVFSRDSAVRLLRELLKVILIAWIGYLYISSHFVKLSVLSQYTITNALSEIVFFIGGLLLRLIPLITFLGIADYLWERFSMYEKMKMTKQEIKEEHKEMEGDPLIKSKRKGKHRALLSAGLKDMVPESDVILVNPTEYAVAIKYNPIMAPAPFVIAKGRGVIAKKIKKLAKEAGVPIVPNKSLARMMYYNVDVGTIIPASTYKTIAVILATVFKRRKKPFKKQ